MGFQNKREINSREKCLKNNNSSGGNGGGGAEEEKIFYENKKKNTGGISVCDDVLIGIEIGRK